MVKKKKYVYQMTPQEYHKYITAYLNAVENARKSCGSNTLESYEKAKEKAREAMSDYKATVLKDLYFSKATLKSE